MWHAVAPSAAPRQADRAFALTRSNQWPPPVSPVSPEVLRIRSIAPGEELRLLVDAVTDYAIFLIDATGQVLTWNEGARRIKGYAPEEIIGRHFSVFYTDEDREAGRPLRLLTEATERGRVEDEGWRVRSDGTRFWADVVITALRDDDGQPYVFAKVTRDLTERRAAEEQRMALAAEQRGRMAAEEALRVRDRFLSIASHELKTPIARVQIAAESIAHALDTERLTPDRLRASVGRITRATERLGVLVGELLDVSRIDAGGLAIERVPVDLVAVTAEVIERFTDLDDAAQRLRLSGDERVMIIGDRSRLDQVLMNLIDNALKYSAAPSQIGVDVRHSNGSAVIRVTDAGIGLDEADGGSIFLAFGRGDNASHVAGIGLGLFIVRDIVERHGGTVTAESRADGGGSTFTVTLPAGEIDGHA